MFQTGDQFPGEKHEQRYNHYTRLRQIVRGMHLAAWTAHKATQQLAGTDYGHDSEAQAILQRLDSDLRVVVNLPRVIERKFANMVTRGLGLSFENAKEPQDKLETILENSGWNTLAHASAFRHGTYGNAVMTMRRTEDGDVIIDSRDPWTWFPDVDPIDPTRVTSHVFAWTVDVDDKTWLVQEEYTPGSILRQANLLYQGAKVGPPTTWEALFGQPYDELEQTGVDVPLVAWWRNVTDEEGVFGDSDFLGNEPLMHEVTARLSQIANILDRHADPKLQGPRDAIKIDVKSGKATLNIKGSRFLPVEDGDKQWSYLTWDGQLKAAFEEFDRAIDLLCINTEMSPALIGLTQGAGIEATDTLRLRAFNTLDAVEAKRSFMSDGLKQMTSIALKLAGVTIDEPVQVVFGDALPLSRNERVAATQAERAAGLISLERAVKQLNPEMTDEQVTQEIELIQSEEQGYLQAEIG